MASPDENNFEKVTALVPITHLKIADIAKVKQYKPAEFTDFYDEILQWPTTKEREPPDCPCTMPYDLDCEEQFYYRRRWSIESCLGYRSHCCGCIPLKPACIIICFLSFFWAFMQLTFAQKIIYNIFLEKSDAYKYTIWAYIGVIIIFVVATATLMYGIITNRPKHIKFYVWIAFFFNCIVIITALTNIGMKLYRINNVGTHIGWLSLVLATIWHTLFFYLLSVVSSFEMDVTY